jgi:hypothetical protein
MRHLELAAAVPRHETGEGQRKCWHTHSSTRALEDFRELAQKHHPDKGGDPAAFRSLVESKDRAVESKDRALALTEGQHDERHWKPFK